jgi:hypothetical protein
MSVSVQKKTKPRTKAEAKLLDSAILLFGKYGYSGISIRDVAKHAGITAMTLYRGRFQLLRPLPEVQTWNRLQNQNGRWLFQV